MYDNTFTDFIINHTFTYNGSNSQSFWLLQKFYLYSFTDFCKILQQFLEGVFWFYYRCLHLVCMALNCQSQGKINGRSPSQYRTLPMKERVINGFVFWSSKMLNKLFALIFWLLLNSEYTISCISCVLLSVGCQGWNKSTKDVQSADGDGSKRWKTNAM